MNVNIKELGNDQEQIEKVQKFLFKMIKKEFTLTLSTLKNTMSSQRETLFLLHTQKREKS